MINENEKTAITLLIEGSSAAEFLYELGKDDRTPGDIADDKADDSEDDIRHDLYLTMLRDGSGVIDALEKLARNR